MVGGRIELHVHALLGLVRVGIHLSLALTLVHGFVCSTGLEL